MRNCIYLLLIGSLFLLIGCKEKVIWYETKETAIEQGLIQEDFDNKSILSIQGINDETIIFFEYQGAIGVASITESNKGFRWYRSRPHFGFDGKTPDYATGRFDYETETGTIVNILFGKAFDTTIEKMKLIQNSSKHELEIFGDSRLFFAVQQLPFTSPEVIPVRK